MPNQKTAVVLFNLGGPDSPEAVRPFLYNLFNDPAILRVPGLFRTPLAYLLAHRAGAKPAARDLRRSSAASPRCWRLPKPRPRSLEAALGDLGEVKAFVAMRYWHPMSDETARQVRRFDPDRIVLLPLYPQFSTTTTASSEKMWPGGEGGRARHADRHGLLLSDRTRLRQGGRRPDPLRASRRQRAHGKPRVLFSAHGLPKKVVAGAAIPTSGRCERTAAAIVRELNVPGSRLGRLLPEPGRAAEMDRPFDRCRDRAGRNRRRAAGGGADRLRLRAFRNPGRARCRIPRTGPARRAFRYFVRVPTVGVEDAFVQGLARLVRQAVRW